MKKGLFLLEPELKDLESSQPIHIAQHEKACSGENTKSVPSHLFDTKLIERTHELSQTSKEPRIELGLHQHQQKRC